MSSNTQIDPEVAARERCAPSDVRKEAEGPVRSKRRWLPPWDLRAGAVCATAALVVVLYFSSQLTHEEVPYSPLYRATLERTYSRFREGDVRIAPGRTAKSVDPPELAERRPGAATDRESEEYVAAEKLEKAGDLDGAIRSFRGALSKYPRSTTIRHRLGDVQRRKGEWKEAVNAYREVLQRDASQLCCFEHMAEIFREQSQPELADRMLQNAIGGYRMWLQAGGAAAQRGMHDLATLYLREKQEPAEALRLAEDLVKNVRNDVSLFLLARCLANAGQHARALEALREVAPADAASIRMVEDFKTVLLAQDAGAPK